MELARMPLCRSPGIVLNSHRKKRDSEREGIGEKRVIRLIRVHFRCLVGLLPSHLALHSLRGGAHAKVDDLHPQIPASVREKDVLQGQVSMSNAHFVQHPDRIEHLQHQRLHDFLPCRPRRRIPVAPAEEVALRCERSHDVRGIAVPEYALRLTDERTAQVVELLHEGDVAPRPLRCSRVLRLELLWSTSNPGGGHALNRHPNLLVRAAVYHLVHPALVSDGILQLAHEFKFARFPGLHRIRCLLHELLEIIAAYGAQALRQVSRARRAVEAGAAIARR
mmetsp:Transcript_8555/g.25961  ORF Transcript_8555/g.25961 Transcript_8555/m.25961 type:complete len:279 (+) Transcript_8555:299-1135(+)